MGEKSVLRHSFITKIDILIIVAVLCGFLFVGLGIKAVTQKDTYVTVELLATGGEWWWGTSPPYYWNMIPVQKGDIEYDVLKKPLVEILDTEKYLEDNRMRVWIKARIKVRKNVRTNVYMFRQNQVQIGKTITIAPNNISILGNVVGIEGISSSGTRKSIEIQALSRGIWDYEAAAIHVGDKMLDDQGRVVAEVLEKNEEQARITTVDWAGNPFLKRDPIKRDVYLKLRLTVNNDGKHNYFSFYQLINPGLQLTIHLDTTTIDPYIVSVVKG